MDLQLSNSSVVITGGVSGIGAACVDMFRAEGAKVAVWDIGCAERAEHTFPDDTAYLPVDVASESSVASAVVETEKAHGPISHLVHSAAIGSGVMGFPFLNLSTSDWKRVVDVNVMGMVNVAHAVAPRMMEQKRGAMVFVASVAGQIGSQTDPPYSASKAANINFAQCLARDLASYQVRVNTVCPGMVKTPLNRSVWRAWMEKQSPGDQLDYDAWAQDKIQKLVPLGCWQDVTDIANMIVFLCSEKASQVTGQTINVDGGYVMHS